VTTTKASFTLSDVEDLAQVLSEEIIVQLLPVVADEIRGWSMETDDGTRAVVVDDMEECVDIDGNAL
jgi:hypothetical protein